MKRILVLLSLIYFISCSTETCNDVKDPQNPNECFSTPVVDSNDYCCYIKVRQYIGTQYQYGSICYEYNKGLSLDEVKNTLINYYTNKGQELEDFRCKGSYLKAGLLLLTAFLL